MRRPKALRIGGREWRIRSVSPDKMGDACGLCHYDKGRIDVATGMTPFDLRDTLLHEALHALLARHGFERTAGMEEAFVTPLATELIGLLQDNPEFAQWLSEPLTAKTTQ